MLFLTSGSYWLNIGFTNWHKKTFSSSPEIKALQIKTAVRYHSHRVHGRGNVLPDPSSRRDLLPARQQCLQQTASSGVRPGHSRDVRCAGLAISARCTALMDNTHSRASHGVPETPGGFARPTSLSDFFLHHIFPLPSFFPRWRSPIRTFSLTELHHGACFRRTPAATWESQLSRTADGETRRHHSGGGSDGTQ